jgi:hypothetical protein
MRTLCLLRYYTLHLANYIFLGLLLYRRLLHGHITRIYDKLVRQRVGRGHEQVLRDELNTTRKQLRRQENTTRDERATARDELRRQHDTARDDRDGALDQLRRQLDDARQEHDAAGVVWTGRMKSLHICARRAFAAAMNNGLPAQLP